MSSYRLAITNNSQADILANSVLANDRRKAAILINSNTVYLRNDVIRLNARLICRTTANNRFLPDHARGRDPCTTLHAQVILLGHIICNGYINNTEIWLLQLTTTL